MSGDLSFLDDSSKLLPKEELLPSKRRLIDRPREAPLVSLVIPAYNEAAILERHLLRLWEYLAKCNAEFTAEIVLVNDGSSDRTGPLADAVANTITNAASANPASANPAPGPPPSTSALPVQPPVPLRVVHHSHNQGLGQALRTGFAAARGRYIVTLDLDLSYAPTHIERLVRHIRRTGAQVVVASPYMPGGKVSDVPWRRLLLSRWANRFLSLTDKRGLSTLTGMVRAYDAAFLRSLQPRAEGMDINPELLHKAQLLKATVEEIPAHLRWLPPKPSVPRLAPARRSSMKIMRQVWAVLFYGFAFRPVMFFLLPALLCLGSGVGLLLWSGFSAGWGADLSQSPNLELPALFRALYGSLLGGVAIATGCQLLSSAALSAQNKFYFEELFHLGTCWGGGWGDRQQSHSAHLPASDGVPPSAHG